MERTFTDREKLDSLNREIGMRRRVYPARIEKGAMTLQSAEYEIAIMQAIAKEYAARVREELLL